MKLRNILTGAFALATLVTAARADVTIYVTGSTAFRAGSVDGIIAKFQTGTGFKYAHDAAAGGTNGSTRSIFQGNFPGITGTTTIACNFTGSVEGVRAVATPSGANNATYLTTAALPAGAATVAGTEAAGVSSPVASQVAKFAFSDVLQSSTPVSSPTLHPANPRVGVIIFTPMVSAGTSANFTNLSSQQYKALFSNGSQPLSLFTGVSTDTTQVLASGRNDGSGTRTTALAESGLGITTLVNQFKSVTSTSANISVMKRIAAGDGTFASTVWGQDLDGNGGYQSGGTLRADFAKTTTSVTVFDADGTTDLLGGAQAINLVTFIGAADAQKVANPTVATPARIIAWNGVSLPSIANTPVSTAMNATDRAKIQYGIYSAWGLENLYYSGTLSTDENTFYTTLKTSIDSRLVANPIEGIRIVDMHVTRPDDGAPIAP